MPLASTSQYCFDVAEPLAPQRYYRAWQTGTPSVIPFLSLLGIAPAITLTGAIGHSGEGRIRLWIGKHTINLTNLVLIPIRPVLIRGRVASPWRISTGGYRPWGA